MMNLKIGAILLLAGLINLGRADAMSFLDFTHMNDDDCATLVANMAAGSAKFLRNQGHPDQAERLIELFKNTSNTGGLHQLVETGKAMNQTNQLNSTNPNNRHAELGVEDAMERMLKHNGFDVPASYLRTITQDFQPQGPPRGLTPTPTP